MPPIHSLWPVAMMITALLVSGCKDAPPPPQPIQRPVVDGNTLRYPASHPQLKTLTEAIAVESKPIDIEMPARVIWDEDRTQRIYPAFAGKVSSILVDVGTRVRAGQALAELASPEFGAAQAEAARARTELSQAQRQLDRVRDLNAIGIASRKELEQAETDTLRAQAELDRAHARTRLYGSADSINQRLTITAGMSGVIAERSINPGQELRPEQFGPGSTALFILTDPSRLWLHIDVRESDLSLLEPGRKIDFIAHAYPDQRFEAEVVAIGDSIDPVTRTLKVRARVDNASRSLKVEMLGRARISRSPGNGVVIPAPAVFNQDGAHWVYVASAPGVFELRKVETANIGAGKLLVRAGLSQGQRVVVENTLLLARMHRASLDSGGAGSGDGRGSPR